MGIYGSYSVYYMWIKIIDCNLNMILAKENYMSASSNESQNSKSLLWGMYF